MWARAVKAKQRRRWDARTRGPVLWVFSDPVRLPDPVALVRGLPPGLERGLLGVVLRHDVAPGVGRALAALCRARGIALSVAGDWRLAAALHAGLHLRGGRRPGTAPRWLKAATSSAHGVADLRRARQAGATGFLSPAFATASHPGRPGLGACRWGLLARRGGGRAALGGVSGASVRRLAGCRAAGTIGAAIGSEAG